MAKPEFPLGKFMAMVKVGAKGQIVIPVEARELLQIQPGDTLLLLADAQRGIALPPHEQSQKIIDSLMWHIDGGDTE